MTNHVPFRKLLFSPLAQSDNAEAIKRTSALARQLDAHLTLLGVVPEPSRLQTLLQSSERIAAVIDQATDDLAAEFARWCPDAGGVDREAVIAVGDPAATIIERVNDESFDLVVVSADRDGPPDPVVKRLLRHCPCPVWVVRPPLGERRDVLAAVNPDPDEFELNRSILETAAMMQSLTGGALHVLHAWQFYGETALRHSAFLHPADVEVDAVVATEHTAHRTALEQLIRSADINLPPLQVHLGRGTADEVISQFIDERPIDLLVIGTVARRNIAGLIVGNTAERVFDTAKCSVVAVKPEWFGRGIG